MNAVALLKDQIGQAHWLLEGTMAAVTPAQAHWIPSGTANPIGASYAHLLLAEDGIVNLLLKGHAPLYASTWAGRVGVSELQPQVGPEWQHYAEWTRRVRVDLAALRSYAQAVYGCTVSYVEALTSEDLDRAMDLSVLGWKQPLTVGFVLGRLIVGHADNICGEISCLKGLQGAGGYPG